MLIPDAIPARSGSTIPIAADASGTLTARADAGDDHAGKKVGPRRGDLTPLISRSPTPTRTKPGAITIRRDLPLSRPAIPDVRKIAPVSGRNRSPVCAGDRPRMCSSRGPGRSEARTSTRDRQRGDQPPSKVGTRTSPKSSIGSRDQLDDHERASITHRGERADHGRRSPAVGRTADQSVDKDGETDGEGQEPGTSGRRANGLRDSST